MSEDVNRSGGVTLAHVSGSSKNAADEKIRDAMKKFVDTHSASYTPVLVLISGDIDFVNDLRAYQMRHGCKVILLHAPKCSEQFKIGWTELHAWEQFCAAPPPQGQGAPHNKQQPQQQKGHGSGQPVPGPSQKQYLPAGPPYQGGGQKQRKDSDTSSTHSNEASGPNRKNKQKQQPSVDNISSGINNLNIQPGVGPGKAGAGATTPSAVNNDPNPPKLPNFILVVMGLPGKMDYMVLREGLQQHAKTVGGKVKYVKNGQGYIGFKTKANAEKALELFNGMEVYGKKLNVQYTSKIPFANLLDKKLKGATPPEDFVMVQANAAATTPNKELKEAQNASGGGGGITDFLNDPGFVGKMAGAMIREMTQRQGGVGKGTGGGAPATANKKEQDSCSIQ